MIETILKIVVIVGPVVKHLTRGRPEAEVHIEKFGANPYKSIRIKNPGPRTVFILDVRAHPPIYAVATDESGTAIVDAVYLDADAKVVLVGGETRDLPIIELPKPMKEQRNAVEAPQDQLVYFVISWRKTSSSRVPQIPVVIPTSTQHINGMAAATVSRRT